jgi:hypothetical protein
MERNYINRKQYILRQLQLYYCFFSPIQDKTVFIFADKFALIGFHPVIWEPENSDKDIFRLTQVQ